MRIEPLLPDLLPSPPRRAHDVLRCLILPGLTLLAYLLVVGWMAWVVRADGMGQGLYEVGVLWAAGLLHWGGWASGLAVLVFFGALIAPTFRDSPPWLRRCQQSGVGGLLLLLAIFILSSLVWPWHYTRIAWPWASILPLLILVYLWFRCNWLSLGMYGCGRRLLRCYLRRYPRATSYLRLLSRLRSRQGGTLSDRFGDAAAPVQRVESAPGDSSAVCGGAAWLLDGLFRCAAWRLWCWCWRPCTPALGIALTDQNPMLCAELEYLRREALHAAEQALYGTDGLVLPPLSEHKAAAQAAFRRYLAYSDALAECCLFDVKLTPPAGAAEPADQPLPPDAARWLKYAAELYADAAGRCLLPTFRRQAAGSASGAEAGNGRSAGDVLWIDAEVGAENGAAEGMACQFLLREILCLERLCGVGAEDPQTRTVGWLESILRRPAEPRARLWQARLVAAVLDYRAVRGRHEAGSRREYDPSSSLWGHLEQAVQDNVDALLAQAAADIGFELGCRARFLDLCWHSSPLQDELLFRQVKHLEETVRQARQLEPRFRQALAATCVHVDARLASTVQLSLARAQAIRQWITAVESLRLALNTARGMQHRCQAALPEFLEPAGKGLEAVGKSLEAIRPELHGAVEGAPALTPPRDDPAPGRAAVHRGELADPRPNVFVRLPAYAASLAGTLVFVGVLAGLWQGERQAVLAVPDFRLGSGALQGPVNTIAPGSEPSPSVWVGTQGAGVHVRAAGEMHHWYHIDSADSGLLTNDVRRIAVGSSRVAYLCARSDRLGLCLSSAPQGRAVPLPASLQRRLATPGATPWLGVDDWWTLLDLSAFGTIDDRDLTVLRQPAGCPLLLLGTSGHGLGRYYLNQRRWLNDPPIDESGGRLLPGQGTIHDLAVYRLGENWQVWLATANGLAGGPVFGPDVRDPAAMWEKWHCIDGSQLLGRTIAQVEAQPSPDGPPNVTYRTPEGGLGTLVPGAEGRHAHVVHVGQRGLEGLSQQSLRRVAYDRDGQRLWLADQPAAATHVRLSAYRERSHEWVATPSAADDITVLNDLVTGPEWPGHALAATGQGLLQLSDHGGDELHVRNLGPKEAAVRQVVAGPKGQQAAVLAQRAADRWPTVAFAAADGETAAWQPAIGPRRAAGLTLSALTALVSEPNTDSFLLGTRDQGIVRIEPGTREVYSPFDASPPPTGRGDALRHVADLAIASFPRARWIYQVSADAVVDVLPGHAPGPWKSVLNHTTGRASPGELVAAKAHRGRLYLGSPQAVSNYDMSRHCWSEASAVPGLKHFLTTNGDLWAEGVGEGEATLYQLVGASSAEEDWKPRFAGFAAADASPERLAVLDKQGAVQIVEGAGEPSPLVKPQFLRPTGEVPRVAAADGSRLYLGPVSGGLGRYELQPHAWTAELPPADAQAPWKQLQVTSRGLWLLDAAGNLFLRPAGADPQSATAWNRVASAIVKVFWDQAEAVWVTTDGKVQQTASGSVETLVGEGFDADLQGATAAVEFGDALFVAVGARIGCYRPAKHAWQSAAPAGEQSLRRLVATRRFLYALSQDDRLFRREAAEEADWEAVSPDLWAVKPLPGAELVPGTAPRLQIAGLDDMLGLIVADAGVLVIADAAPQAPRWLLAQSLAMPADAEVTCGVEVGDELCLGTRRHGLWTYQSGTVDGQQVPPMWVRVPLARKDAGPQEIRRIVLLPGPPMELGVLTNQGLHRLRRGPSGVWQLFESVQPGAVGQLAASAAGYFLAAPGAEQGPVLWHLPSAGTLVPLIGPACPHRQAPTAAVAVNPADGRLFRADAQGRIAAYSWESHSWEEASVPAGPKVTRLPVAAGSLWAWAPGEHQLLERKGDAWQTRSTQTQALTSDDAGLLLHQGPAGVQLWDSGGVRTLLPPAARGEFPAAWQDVERLAECGPWLVVSTAAQGVYGYHRPTHRWQKLGADRLQALELLEADSQQKPSAYYAANAAGRLLRLTAGQTPQLEPVDLPGKTPLRKLTRSADFVVALSADRVVHALDPKGTAHQAWLRPMYVDEPAPPTLQAATEYGDTLVLSYQPDREKTAGAGAGRLAFYQPDAMQWRVLDVAEGVVLRFHRLGPPGKGERLFAEIRMADRSEPPYVQVAEILPPDGTRAAWSYRLVGQPVYDVAACSQGLLAVGAERRALVLPPGSGQFETAELAAGDELPGEIQSACAVGDAVLALLADKTLWRYSLGDLRWQPQEPHRKFLKLIVAGGNLFAVQDATWDVFRYAQSDGPPQWTALPPAADNVLGATIVLEGRSPGLQTLWSLRSEEGRHLFTWRPATGEGAPSTEVGFSAGRLDFNRYARLQSQQDTLWLETLAHLDGQPVYRQFALRQGVPGEERLVGAARFAIPPAEAQAHLEKASPLVFEGRRFRLGPPQDGAPAAWKAVEQDGSEVNYALLVQRPAGTPVAARPMMLDGQRWGLDIDAVNDVEGRGEELILATAAGLWKCRPTPDADQPLAFTAFTPTDAPVAALVADGDRLFARLPGEEQRYLALDAGREWGPTTDDELAVISGRLGLRQSARHLSAWQVEPGDGSQYALRLRLEEDQAFRPVTLDRGGFGFDDVWGLGLAPDAVYLETADGRVKYLRQGDDALPQALQPERKASSSAAGRIVPDPDGKRPLLLVEDPPAARALVLEEGAWRPLSAAEFEALQGSLAKTLWDSGGWRWNGDETVRVTLPLPGQPALAGPAPPLDGRFDLESGRFGFDTVRAVEACPEEAWVVTDAAILHFAGPHMTAVSLPELASPGPLEAQIVRDLEGTWYLEARAAGASASTWYARGEQWSPSDPAAAAAAVAEARRWAVHGPTWRLPAAVRSAMAGDASCAAATADRAGGEQFVGVDFTPAGGWNFEDVRALAAAEGGRIVLGSAFGLCRIPLSSPVRAAWELAATPSAVTRLETDQPSRQLHLALADDGEWLHDAAALTAVRKASPTFTQEDRTLLAGARWQCTRDDEGRLAVQVRLAERAEYRPTQFDHGRFDFDCVAAAALLPAGSLLGTDAGFFLRPAAADGALLPVEGLSAEGAEDPRDLFVIVERGQRRTFAAEGDKLFEFAADAWTAMPQPQAEALGPQRTTFVTGSANWSVDRLPEPGRGLTIRLSGEPFPEQPLVYRPELGGFTCDSYRFVLWAPGPDQAPQLIVATAGGLCTFGLDGGLASLVADLDGDQSPDEILGLWATARGPVALARCGVERYFLRTEGAWSEIGKDEARQWIDEQNARIDVSDTEWDVRRLAGPGRGAAAFRLQWQLQPLALVEGDRARFRHDQARAAWAEGDTLWIAADGGIQRWTIDSADGGLRAPSERHLWTSSFDSGSAAVPQRPFALRSGGPDQARQPCCRTLRGTEQGCLLWNPENSTWDECSGDDAQAAVLLDVPGVWRWVLAGPGRIRVELDPQYFEVLPNLAASRLFEDGTFSFWNVGAAGNGPADVLALAGDWFIATSAGVLCLDGADRSFKKFYGRSQAGQSLERTAELALDADGGLLARAAAGVFRFQHGGWQPVNAALPSRRRQPVAGAHVVFQPGDNRLDVALRPDVTSLPPARAPHGNALFSDGRWAFDIVRQFAVDGETLWLLTPVGIVRLNAGDGAIRHYGTVWTDRPTDSLCLADGRLCALGPQDGVALFDGQHWSKPRTSPEFVARLREVVTNELFTCRRTATGSFVVRFLVGDLPPLMLGLTPEPLLRSGVFAFDDLRDASFHGDQLLAATRLGLWTYDLTLDPQRRCIPVDVRYFARAERGPDVPMCNLDSFFRQPDAPHWTVVGQAPGGRRFCRQWDAEAALWRVDAAPPPAANTRSLRWAADESLELEARDVSLTGHLRSGANGRPLFSVPGRDLAWSPQLRLSDAFCTTCAAYLPLERGVLWVRRYP